MSKVVPVARVDEVSVVAAFELEATPLDGWREHAGGAHVAAIGDGGGVKG